MFPPVDIREYTRQSPSIETIQITSGGIYKQSKATIAKYFSSSKTKTIVTLTRILSEIVLYVNYTTFVHISCANLQVTFL